MQDTKCWLLPADIETQPTDVLLRFVHMMIRELHGDISAMGDSPEVHAKALAALRDLSQALETTRRQSIPFVDQQMRERKLDDHSRDLKVQLGGGAKEQPGWVNVDLEPTQLRLNLRWGLPFGDGSVTHLFTCHMLEHFFYPFESNELLKEIYRVLAPGGRLRLIVPHIGKFAQAYVQNDQAFFEQRKEAWPWLQCRTPLEHMLEYAGANQYDASFIGHKYGYDLETLQLCLQQTGFQHITESAYMQSTCPELNLDHLSPFASAHSGADRYSLYVDAVK